MATAVGLLAAAGLLLAACSSSAPSAHRTTTTTTSTTAAPTRPGTTGATGSSSTTAPAAVAACGSGSLVLAEDVAKSTTSAGSADIVFTLTSTASTPCSLRGYPSVAFRSGTGASATTVKLGTTTTGPSPATVVLDSGGVAAFYLVVGNVPVGGVGCVNVGAIEVTPPGGGSPLGVAASLSACGPSVGVTALEPIGDLST